MRGAGASGLDRGLLARMKPEQWGSAWCVHAKASPGHTHLSSPTREEREEKWRATATSLTSLDRSSLGKNTLEEPALENTKSIEKLTKKTASNFRKQMNSHVRHLI